MLGLVKTGNPSRYFGEGRFTTAISCGQLLLAAFFSFSIFQARRAQTVGRESAGYWLWAFVAGGFVFLAADDAFQFHEQMDKVINKIFHLPKTALTDRIDDAIICLYALIGLWVLWMFRKEMRDFRRMLLPLIVGFVFAFASMVCDTLGNREDVFFWLTNDRALAKRLEGWADTGDGAFTLLAEGMFAGAFYFGWRESRAVTKPKIAATSAAA
jgi:hypothetical protein